MLLSTTIMRSINQIKIILERERERDLSIHSFYDKMQNSLCYTDMK